MRLGSLFSGAGLGDLGWHMSGMDIRWQVERDDYCRKILELRFPDVRRYGDIREFKPREAEAVDIVVGGFPCQPFSTGGNQRGDQDDRNLWKEMFRVISESRPAWVVGENVPGIIPLYLDTVLADLEAQGYSCRTFSFSAHALGASHRRERIWIVGCSKDNHRRLSRQAREEDPDVERSGEASRSPGDSEHVRRAPSEVTGWAGKRDEQTQTRADTTLQPERPSEAPDVRALVETFRNHWATEPDVDRLVHGSSVWMDRFGAIGNGQVPACTAFIGALIIQADRECREGAT